MCTYICTPICCVCNLNPIKNIYEFLCSQSEVNPVQWPGYKCHSRLESLNRHQLFQVGISFPLRYHLCRLSWFFFHWRVTEGLRMSDNPSTTVHSQCHTSLLTCSNTSWYVLALSMQSFYKVWTSHPLAPWWSIGNRGKQHFIPLMKYKQFRAPERSSTAGAELLTHMACDSACHPQW